MSSVSYSHTETIYRSVTLPNGRKVTQAVGSQDVANNGGVIDTRYYRDPVDVDAQQRA